MPIPFFNSPNSLGFICKIVFAIIVVIMNINKIDKKYSYIIILLPSTILYTGIGLKDTLVLLLMVISLLGITKNNLIFTLIPIMLLMYLRFQNGIFLVMIYFTYQLFFIRSFYSFISGIFFLTFPFFYFYEKIINNVSLSSINNSYRDFRYSDNIPTDQIGTFPLLTQNPFFLLDDFIIGNFNFYFSPTITSAKNLFQIIQSLENYILIFFILYIFVKFININFYKCLFWFTHLFIMSGLYGIVINNAGTLVKMKFSLVLSFLIIIVYDLKRSLKE